MVQILNGQKGRLIKYETIKDIVGVPEGYILTDIRTSEKDTCVDFVKDIDITGLFLNDPKIYSKIIETEELKNKLRSKGINVGDEVLGFTKFVGFKENETKRRGARITCSDERVDYDKFEMLSSRDFFWPKKYPERVYFMIAEKSYDMEEIFDLPFSDSELI